MEAGKKAADVISICCYMKIIARKMDAIKLLSFSQSQ